MNNTDKKKPVMVTGATGYVAGWIVKKLLDEGMTVHAAVRDPQKTSKLQHLNNIAARSPGTIVYFKSDLLEDGSYAGAMEGCEVVYHTASPFTSDYKDPQKELIDPALNGTRNVLQQANKISSVNRVVVTSSCAAIYTDCTDAENTPNGLFSEKIWNTTASVDYQPYSYSKTLAEKEAWLIAGKQDRWKLVTINPCFILGPALNPKSATSESFSLLKQMGDGTLKMGVPNVGLGLVDVRDVAEAHFQAGFSDKANGRNIVCGHSSSFLEMAQLLYSEYGENYPVPNSALPKWLIMFVGPMVNKALSRKFIKNNVNKEWKADNSKSKRELGISYRPLKETMMDSFDVLIDSGMVKKK